MAEENSDAKMERLLNGIDAITSMCDDIKTKHDAAMGRLDAMQKRMDDDDAKAKKDAEEDGKKEEERKKDDEAIRRMDDDDKSRRDARRKGDDDDAGMRHYSGRRDDDDDDSYKKRHDAEEKTEAEEMEAKGEKKEAAADKAKRHRKDAEEEEAEDDARKRRHDDYAGRRKADANPEIMRRAADDAARRKSRRDDDDSRRRHDSAMTRENAGLRETIRSMQQTMSYAMTEQTQDERDALASAQVRADSVAAMFGERASPPTLGETSIAYRKRLLGKYLQHSPKLKEAKLDSVDAGTLTLLENQVFADAMQAAKSDGNSKVGVLIPRYETDSAGRRITRFDGDNLAWMQHFMTGGQSGKFVRPSQSGRA